MALHDNYSLAGEMRALLGRFPTLEDEPQLGALLQLEVRSYLSLLDARSRFTIIKLYLLDLCPGKVLCACISANHCPPSEYSASWWKWATVISYISASFV